MARSATSSSEMARDGDIGVAGANGTEEKQNHVDGNVDVNAKSEDERGTEKKEKKPSFLAKTWKKLDLDIPTALMMMK